MANFLEIFGTKSKSQTFCTENENKGECVKQEENEFTKSFICVAIGDDMNLKVGEIPKRLKKKVEDGKVYRYVFYNGNLIDLVESEEHRKILMERPDNVRCIPFRSDVFGDKGIQGLTGNKLVDTVLSGEKVTFMEYLIALRSYGELEFDYDGVKYVTLRLNNEYSFSNSEHWNRSKDFYVLFENDNHKNAQIFSTIDETYEKATLGGKLIKDVFDKTTYTGELSVDSYHGFGAHDHKWYGEDRGPARKLNHKDYPS